MDEYIVEKNPNNKKWYVCGRVGRYYMPISDGFKSKKAALKRMHIQPIIDKDAKKCIV